jgi:hypothetical protein
MGPTCTGDPVIGVGPSHAPPAAVGADYEDICRRLKMVLQDVPEGLWSSIQDETFLEHCVGFHPHGGPL